MKIREVNENKKLFISLLLLADEQESMVDRYLEKGTMYVLEDNDVKAECVVTEEYQADQLFPKAPPPFCRLHRLS